MAAKNMTLKSVTFALKLETVHIVESYKTEALGDVNASESTLLSTSGCLTEDITVLSSKHGQQRRYLRDIDKGDLQAAVKYGVKNPGHPDPKTGLPRWKFTFTNTVYITDYTCGGEITSYKQSVTIHPATLTPRMGICHYQVKSIIENQPQLCTSHTVVVLDQSGSMRSADVNGFRNRSQAAYGCLALDFVAQQLYEQGDKPGADSFTLIEMNDAGTQVFSEEPLDRILFNGLLTRQQEAEPRSHGNYLNSLLLAQTLILQEIELLAETELEDFSAFFLIVLSDGKPSDKDEYSMMVRRQVMSQLATKLKSKLAVLCMGLGASGSDFEELEGLVTIARLFGATSEFSHAGLSAANLAKSFSSISSTMTSVHQSMLSTPDEEKNQVEDTRPIVKLSDRKSLAKSRTGWVKFTEGVDRFAFVVKRWDEY